MSPIFQEIKCLYADGEGGGIKEEHERKSTIELDSN